MKTADWNPSKETLNPINRIFLFFIRVHFIFPLLVLLLKTLNASRRQSCQFFQKLSVRLYSILIIKFQIYTNTFVFPQGMIARAGFP